MTLPTFKEVWSKYLFNQSTPITGDALLDENLIRPNSDGSKNMILGNVIRNCLRQDSVNKVLFLRFISLSDGSQRVLR